MGPPNSQIYIFFAFSMFFLHHYCIFFASLCFSCNIMSYLKKNYIYIYIFFNFFIYGVSPDVSIFWGPVSYRPGFGNLETFPRFVQLRFVDLCTLGGVPHVLFLLSTCGRDICLCPMYFMFYFVLDFG
jgi:hypothetical protein